MWNDFQMRNFILFLRKEIISNSHIYGYCKIYLHLEAVFFSTDKSSMHVDTYV